MENINHYIISDDDTIQVEQAEGAHYVRVQDSEPWGSSLRIEGSSDKLHQIARAILDNIPVPVPDEETEKAA